MRPEDDEGGNVKIWVDADACPGAIKDLIFRASRRLALPVYLVANRSIHIPPSSLVRLIQVGKAPDAADHYIAAHVAPHDLVVTADIPLAAAVVDKQAMAIDPRGEIYTDENVKDRLAMRNLMQDLRTSGLVQGGPAQLAATDRQKFAAALDRSLTQLLKRR
jgi:uncharacterized protein YaiI (UPF0178 family)